jgi:hypothetical protein
MLCANNFRKSVKSGFALGGNDRGSFRALGLIEDCSCSAASASKLGEFRCRNIPWSGFGSQNS